MSGDDLDMFIKRLENIKNEIELIISNLDSS